MANAGSLTPIPWPLEAKLSQRLKQWRAIAHQHTGKTRTHRWRELLRLWSQADGYADQKNYSSALQAGERALLLASTLSAPALRASLALTVAQWSIDQGDARHSLHVLQQTLRDLPVGSKPEHAVRLLARLARHHAEKSHWQQALAHLEDILPRLPASATPATQDVQLQTLEALRHLGHWAAAMSMISRLQKELLPEHTRRFDRLQTLLALDRLDAQTALQTQDPQLQDIARRMQAAPDTDMPLWLAAPEDDSPLIERWRHAFQNDDRTRCMRTLERMAREQAQEKLWLCAGATALRFAAQHESDFAHDALWRFRRALAAHLIGIPKDEYARALSHPWVVRVLGLSNAAELTAHDAPHSPERWKIQHLFADGLNVEAVGEAFMDLLPAVLSEASRFNVRMVVWEMNPAITQGQARLLWSGGRGPAQPLVDILLEESANSRMTLCDFSDLPATLQNREQALHFLHHTVAVLPLGDGQWLGGAVYIERPMVGGLFSPAQRQSLHYLALCTGLALRTAYWRGLQADQSRELDQTQQLLTERLQALETQMNEQRRERRMAATQPRTSTTVRPFVIGTSKRIAGLLAFLDRIRNSTAPVLIQGESGTGKEWVARTIQSESRLAEKPFLSVNCAAIAPGLMESELFGHERGAFTGADSEHTGLFEQANGGTLFLDEIGDMPLMMQVKLLRVLQEGEIRRVGGSEALPVQVRLICASHRDLKAMARDGKFRDDLLFRLNVIRILMPPLRERAEDILPLAQHFLISYAHRDRHALVLHPKVIHALTTYPWPGNVRELQNLMQKLATLCDGPQVMLNDLPSYIVNAAQRPAVAPELPAQPQDFHRATAQFECAYLENALAANHYNVSQAARACGMHRSTFRRLLAQHRIKLPKESAKEND